MLPYSLVAVSVMSNTPELAQVMFCGLAKVLVAGVPPSNVQRYEVGAFVLVLVKSTCVFLHTLLSWMVIEATGGLPTGVVSSKQNVWILSAPQLPDPLAKTVPDGLVNAYDPLVNP